ncbi:MAG: oxidoreductase [Opitutales bacterium TMED158]|nr:MAG: oxidoreductase [Opitutales bacterium TMED158]
MSEIQGTRVALIGCGYWGRNLARNFHEAGALELVCDPSESAHAFIQEKYPDVRMCSDLASAFDDESIDAVAIATPATTHVDLATKALAAGKDVYIEKPLALDVRRGEALVEEANRLGRILMVGHLLWYHPVVLKLKRLIDEGALGKLRYITSHRLNFGKVRHEENVLWSFAPHDISVILGLVGESPEVHSCTGGRYLSAEVADVTYTELRFPSGIRAHLFTSWLHPFKEQKLVVVGEERMAVFDDVEKEAKLVLYDHDVQWEKGIPVAVKSAGEAVDYEASEPLRNEVDAFLKSVVSRQAPYTDGPEGLRVLRVLKDCQAALDGESVRR